MTHCVGCNGLVYGGYDDGEHDPCPGCRECAEKDAEIARLVAERDECQKGMYENAIEIKSLNAKIAKQHESSIRLVEEFNRFLLAIKEHDHERTGS